MQKELLRMENIVKTFPGVKALNNAAITVHAGEVMGFMGENGAGKSTLMNVLGGVFPADSGDIYIEGKKVAIHSIHESQALGSCIYPSGTCAGAISYNCREHLSWKRDEELFWYGK